MKKFKLFLCVFVLMLSACGDPTDEPYPPPSEAPVSQPKELLSNKGTETPYPPNPEFADEIFTPSPEHQQLLPGAVGSIQSQINAASANAVLHIPAGNYGTERLSISNGKTVICDEPRKCIIKGAVLSGNNATLDGFHSLNSDTNDGALVASGSGNLITNNLVEGSCMVGIKITGSNTASNNEITKSRQCGGSGADADGIRYFGNAPVISGNYIHGILYDSSVNTVAHIDCFQTWGGASGAIIENNICDNPTANSTLAGSGANIENDNGATFRNNYFRTAGKQIMVEASSSNTIIDRNIFISGPVISFPPYQYGIFGSGSNETATNNIFFGKHSENGTSFTMGVSNSSGNLLDTDPKLNGYCSQAYPNIGVQCGSLPAGSPTPIAATRTLVSTATRTRTPSPSATNTLTLSPSATITLTLPSTLTGTIVPTGEGSATSTPTVTRTVTVVPSRTPTRVPTLAVMTVTSTSTSGDRCAKITWTFGLNIRPSASAFNSSIGYYLPGKTITIEDVITNSEGTWAQVNKGQFFAIKLLSNGRTYAQVISCP